MHIILMNINKVDGKTLKYLIVLNGKEITVSGKLVLMLLIVQWMDSDGENNHVQFVGLQYSSK